MAVAGKDTIIKISTSNSSGNVVKGLNSADMSLDGNLIDVTDFGPDYIKRILGLKDVSFTLSGFWLSTDTNGQVKAKNAVNNGTLVYLYFYPNTTSSTGFKAPCRGSNFSISATPDGAVTASFEFQNASSSGLSGA